MKSKKKKNQSLNMKKVLLVALIFIAAVTFLFLQTSKKSSNAPTNTAKNTEETNNTIENTPTPTKEEKKEPSLTTFNMLVTGDIMCHDSMYIDAYNSSTKTYDFSYMFDDIKYYIQTADISVGNLETTFAGKERGYSNYPTFNTPEQLGDALKDIGFDVVSTANNHCMDKGYTGLVSTIEYLDKIGLDHTGTFTSEESSKEILIKDVKGVKIAFLSYTYGTNGIPVPKDKSYAVNLIDKDLILEHLKLAKKENPDMICVCMHWGIEYQTKPNNTQKDLADFLFKNGADVIIGNHPHVPQPMEKRTIELEDGITKDGFIIYSLGNFMADQRAQYTRDSALLNINITKNNDTGKISINEATYTPTYYYKNTAVSKKKFKILDIEKEVENYEKGKSNSVGKTLYNTLATELKNIKKIIGDEIKNN